MNQNELTAERAAKNVPYVKHYDKNGKLTNPIETGFFQYGPNRKARRAPLQKCRFAGNGNNTPILIIKTTKFYKVVQRYFNKKGEKVVINHALPA